MLALKCQDTKYHSVSSNKFQRAVKRVFGVSLSNKIGTQFVVCINT